MRQGEAGHRVRDQVGSGVTVAAGILDWARDQAVYAQEHGCSLKKFIFPSDFERYLYARMMTDRSVTSEDFNVEPTVQSGVTITTLIGIPCKFTGRLPHGRTLFLYDTGSVPEYDPITEDYPEEVTPPKGAA